jgi:hypothetical protein
VLKIVICMKRRPEMSRAEFQAYWFDSLEALIAATSTDEGRRAARRHAEDQARFIDFWRSRIFFVDENVVV